MIFQVKLFGLIPQIDSADWVIFTTRKYISTMETMQGQGRVIQSQNLLIVQLCGSSHLADQSFPWRNHTLLHRRKQLNIIIKNLILTLQSRDFYKSRGTTYWSPCFQFLVSWNVRRAIICIILSYFGCKASILSRIKPTSLHYLGIKGVGISSGHELCKNVHIFLCLGSKYRTLGSITTTRRTLWMVIND